ncbi:thrombospondin type-1 domain-containing protein 7B [Cynoglossus semilaevis]|uniref:thrombospondin type-1 domain-containing protein 7B n=1 Tax=Cynoglossus semilaevis TaxID=244447 RepID=UPI000D630F1C|nr:thrombospondin type-1 domain-containing protein 7B [Cynoglossus semilaevis]
MDRTMVLKDDLRVDSWTPRAGHHLGFFVLLSLLSCSVQSDVVFSKDHHFSWRAGQWGQCVGDVCGSDGVQTRSVWCVHLEGWTTHHSHCPRTDKPLGRRPCFKVCDWHQDLFEWEVSNWSSCVLVPFFSNELKLRTPECITAQHGVQRRQVHCVRALNRTAVTSRICEFFSQRPAVEQACLVPCPHDCVLSHFTPWSSCSKTCGAGLQHRTRHVLATPMYGGASCPGLTETRTCSNPVSCPPAGGEYQYTLRVGAWSDCRLPPDKDAPSSGRTTVDFSSSAAENNSVTQHVSASRRQDHQGRHQDRHHGPHSHNKYHMSWELEVGYQTRQVRCTRSDGKNAMMSLCVKDDPPLTYQACVMSKDCHVSDWSAWSPCSKTCQSTDLSPGYSLRSRIMTQIPVGGGRRCPALEEKEACNIIGDLLPNCPRWGWRTTDWDECHILPLLSQQERRSANFSTLCGVGIQTRRTYCVQVPDDSTARVRREFSRPVSSRHCAALEPPLAVQRCSVPCQNQCLLTPWSSWSGCRHDNCEEPQGRKGFRQRRREVLWEVKGSAEPCPHLVESVPCEDPACFLWQVQEGGGCVLSGQTCGPGSVVQNVSCVNVEGEEVSADHCEGDPPPTQLLCEVPCEEDCVIGSWSSWSSCSHSCSTKTSEGRQSRTRSVLAVPGQGGKACPAAPALEEWKVCNDHPCVVYHWEASVWGPCIQDTSMYFNGTGGLGGAPPCAVGVQIRKVSCVKTNVGPVINKRCPDSSRPETIRPCFLPCQKDCVVTPFSEWTSCPSTCVPENTSVPTQSRYKVIIQRPANGGQECPDTVYEERECESLPLCPVFSWTTHKWHGCTLVPESIRRGLNGPGEPCGTGLETRGVSCVGEGGEPANMTECSRWAGPSPPQFRECQVTCKDDCTLSPWSQFSQCTGCGTSRSRTRTLTGRSKKKEQCLKEEQFPLEESQACPCEEYLSQPCGNWSACLLPAHSLSDSVQGWMNPREVKECGQGLRYRAVACVDLRGHLVEPSLCTDTGYAVETCHVPCPLDCKLSDWSAWSACSASCDSGLKIRSRWLREKAFNGGRPCPKLDLKNQAQVYQAVPCYSKCSQFEWRPDPWSICTINAVDDLLVCGEGVQSRKIRCVRVDTSGQTVTVDDGLCDQEEAPPRAQVCVLACPKDCVVSSWGTWSRCSLQCDQGTLRNRSRNVLRPPASQNPACPDLVQSESCIFNSTCFTYHYQVSEWSSCHLGENAVCGEGLQLRLLNCIRSDGRMVERWKCEQFGLTDTWTLSRPCAVDCPVSCLLSDWSPWAECSRTCGSRAQSLRTRRILQEAHEEGRPCPSQLTQTKPCPIKPCYMWLLTDWSRCVVEGAECGEGLRRRNLSCVVHWGDWPESPPHRVEDELCGDRKKQQIQQEMEQPCFVPCPGDCHLTDWSLWSSCQLTCLEGRSFETTGRQARSRAVIVQVMENQASCPHQVFETRPCKEGKCHSYHWRAGGWSNNQRVVWCQRSDGVNVTGGCFLQKKPTTLRHCHPPCTKPFSHCTPSGVCGCEKGYTEVMTTHGFLDYCTRTPGLDNNKKADVKTNSGRLRPGPAQNQDLFSEWSLPPVGPDGRVKLWVYAVTAFGFVVILFVITLSYLLCKPSKSTKTSAPPQKPLTLAYDGDMDM